MGMPRRAAARTTESERDWILVDAKKDAGF